MAQHDYVLDNATGANFRSDLNNALLAISSNNSGSSAPSTTYALQFYADTTNNILKLRNAANDGFINLFTLAGGVDVDAASNFNEDVTFTGASANIVFDKSDNQLEFADNAKAEFGTGGDLEIYHDGTDNHIVSTNGQINIQTNSTENSIQCIPNGAVKLFHDNNLQVITSSTGIDFADNKKANFGGEDDLQIYHDGSNSYIDDSGTGNLLIRGNNIELHKYTGEDYLKCIANGAVELYFDNAKKAETVTGGFTITGTCTATAFAGDGSALTGITGTSTTINNNADNRVITGSGTADTLNGEANLTFDGANLLLNSAGGNVLFGETTAYNTFENGSTNPKLQVRGTNLNGSCQAWIRATADGGAPKLFIANTRNTSSNGHTIVQSGDELGGIFFAGSDGSQFVNGASISAVVSGTPSADDVPAFLSFGTNSGGAATTERMRIDSSGRLLVGTTTEGDTLADNFTIADSSSNCGMTIRSGSSSFGTIFFSDATSGAGEYVGQIVYDHSANEMKSIVNGAEVVRLKAGNDGSNDFIRVLIGTSTETFAAVCLKVHAGNFQPLSINDSSGTSSFTARIGFRTGNTQVGTIKSSNSATQYNTSSDYRLKENASAISDGITRIKTLKPYKFNWISDETNTPVDGFFAHEVSSVVPEAISGTKDKVADAADVRRGDALKVGDPVYQEIDQSKLVPLLVAAVQELVTKVEALEAA